MRTLLRSSGGQGEPETGFAEDTKRGAVPSAAAGERQKILQHLGEPACSSHLTLS